MKTIRMQILSFGIIEANGYVYDVDLCQEIARGIWLGTFRGFTDNKGATVYPSDAVNISDIKAEILDDGLFLFGDFDIDETKLPEKFKNFFDKAYRIVVETTDTETDEKDDRHIIRCRFSDYMIEVCDELRE